MAQLGNYVSEQLAEPSNDFSPIPVGTYAMEVIESDIAETKNGKGTLLKMTLRVTEGEFENRRVWAQFNIRHENQQAQEIGQRQLSDLSRACGFTANPSDSEDFHGIPIKVSVKIGKAQEGYEPRNEVSRFIAADQIAPAVSPRQSAAPQQRAAAPQHNVTGKAPPPWKRSA